MEPSLEKDRERERESVCCEREKDFRGFVIVDALGKHLGLSKIEEPQQTFRLIILEPCWCYCCMIQLPPGARTLHIFFSFFLF